MATLQKELNRVHLDEQNPAVTEEKAMIGKRVFTSTCGFRVTGKTTHSALVYMTVTDTPTIWSDLV